VRLVQIGPDAAPVDLQPCGGTHVASTAQVGRVTVAKVENKGRQNRRIALVLEG
jgi:misacylated tRNA(Ala) deacylase